jgi:hypothetical protein
MFSDPAGYWRATRAPRHSLLFALPLLALYEVLAFALSGTELGQVRNGADVLLKSLFTGPGRPLWCDGLQRAAARCRNLAGDPGPSPAGPIVPRFFAGCFWSLCSTPSCWAG